MSLSSCKLSLEEAIKEEAVMAAQTIGNGPEREKLWQAVLTEREKLRQEILMYRELFEIERASEAEIFNIEKNMNAIVQKRNLPNNSQEKREVTWPLLDEIRDLKNKSVMREDFRYRARYAKET